MSVVVTLIFNGLSNGALYFLMSAGLTLIFGLLRVINFAHGAFYLWGAYAGVFLYSVLHNFPLAILGGVMVGVVLGFLTERGLMAKVYQDPTRQLLLTMGVLLVLTELLKIPFGRDPVGATTPSILANSWLLGHFVLVEYQVFTLGILYILIVRFLPQGILGSVVARGGVVSWRNLPRFKKSQT
ncbi:branched-chain amino acid ABC transporter permease [Alicyclobacillaceae bacterium I2511]|jgi:branched-chain amino acid transport system permease protein|nr:branched-chain amino acid ABC transporter permease [Alicyclobacillaceae bacterium I2511]